jgi:Ribbon-helix-helix protein, copG family.
MGMRVITFKLEEEMVELLDRYAIRNGYNRSEVIRKAIERILSVDNDKVTFKVEKVRM